MKSLENQRKPSENTGWVPPLLFSLGFLWFSSVFILIVLVLILVGGQLCNNPKDLSNSTFVDSLNLVSGVSGVFFWCLGGTLFRVWGRFRDISVAFWELFRSF